jgi:hypothetical protein
VSASRRETYIYRLVHIGNLPTLLARGGLHAPSQLHTDGLPYRATHNVALQSRRRTVRIPCGPGGTIGDYVPFYFGRHTPMLLQLATGQVAGYDEGQEPIVHLVSTVESVQEARLAFVFSNGHGLMELTEWFDDASRLDRIDWAVVGDRYWARSEEDPDRQRRKQAEFLVHRFCPWKVVRGIAVMNDDMRRRVEAILDRGPASFRCAVAVRRTWYY